MEGIVNIVGTEPLKRSSIFYLLPLSRFKGPMGIPRLSFDQRNARFILQKYIIRNFRSSSF
jgi:hypothetical protein